MDLIFYFQRNLAWALRTSWAGGRGGGRGERGALPSPTLRPIYSSKGICAAEKSIAKGQRRRIGSGRVRLPPCTILVYFPAVGCARLRRFQVPGVLVHDTPFPVYAAATAFARAGFPTRGPGSVRWPVEALFSVLGLEAPVRDGGEASGTPLHIPTRRGTSLSLGLSAESPCSSPTQWFSTFFRL